MKFYAYKPELDGREPLGTANRILFELKTIAGAKRKAAKLLGPSAKLFTYWNFYDQKTFKQH
jgi:hypothetical protein